MFDLSGMTALVTGASGGLGSAIARALDGAEGIELAPNPPHTNMMRIHLRVDEKAFRANAVRIARDRAVYTWPQSAPGPTPRDRTIELTVGDATLAFKPSEVAAIIGELVSG